jgi:hypothetical protein
MVPIPTVITDGERGGWGESKRRKERRMLLPDISPKFVSFRPGNNSFRTYVIDFALTKENL